MAPKKAAKHEDEDESKSNVKADEAAEEQHAKNEQAEDKPEARFPKITEQGLADIRSRIGVKIENTVEPWNYEATRDGIRHYAHGIGDDNPLWCDPAYAE